MQIIHALQTTFHATLEQTYFGRFFNPEIPLRNPGISLQPFTKLVSLSIYVSHFVAETIDSSNTDERPESQMHATKWKVFESSLPSNIQNLKIFARDSILNKGEIGAFSLALRVYVDKRSEGGLCGLQELCLAEMTLDTHRAFSNDHHLQKSCSDSASRLHHEFLLQDKDCTVFCGVHPDVDLDSEPIASRSNVVEV